MSDWWSADPIAGDGVNSQTGRLSITVRPQPRYADAIGSVESGGDYAATGPVTRTGDRAYGKYQVMGANVGPWTREVLGRELTPQEFAASPSAQDAVFKAKFGSYVQKYGPEGAARAWFAGEGGMNDLGRKDILGTTVEGYAGKFNRAMGFAPEERTAPVAKPQQTQEAWWNNDPIASAENHVEQRFAEPAEPENADALRRGLVERGAEMTRGPALPPMANAAIDLENQRIAAMQRTTPNIAAHQSNLISTEVYQNDAGDIQYKDPATGQIVTTDQAKHVTLRDPADGRLKVFARTPETDESKIVGVARTLAPGLAAGAPTARAAIGGTKAIQPAASDIFATAKPSYRAFKAEASGIAIPAEAAKGMAERVRGALDKANLIDELAPAVYKAVGILDKGEPLTLDALQNVKRVVGRGFNSPDKNVRDAASVASKEISKILAETSNSAAKSLKTADDIHSTALAVQDLQRKSAVADLRTGRAGYGGNAVNSMRQVLSPIVQKAVEGRSTLFKPDEIAAMREIVEGTPAANAARLVGQMSPTKGVIQGGGSIAAVIAAGPAGLAIPALGIASNKLATVLTGKQIDHLKELVTKRSPAYAAAVAKATERYNRAQIELANKPTPANFAAYLSASRSLAAGLTRDGVQVSSGDLLRAIQGPMRGAAEDEQQ